MRLSSSADFDRAYDRMIKQMQVGHGKPSQTNKVK